jgi:hypothetical protein
MKVLIFLALLTAQTAFADATGKTLIYCDYSTEAQFIYMDLLFDYDAQKDTYSTPEVGFVVDENSAYPDYLGNVSAVYNNDIVMITATKDMNEMNFSLPANGGVDLPAIVLNKSNGFVADFQIQVTGTYNGAPLDAEFICYDPAASAPQENTVR